MKYNYGNKEHKKPMRLKEKLMGDNSAYHLL